MEATAWFGEHWSELLQSAGIIGSLALAAYTAWKDEQARRIGNSIAITEQHREIWKTIYEHPQLARVLEMNTDIEHEPISIGEELFVTTIIAHLSTVFRAMKHGEFVQVEGMQLDVKEFFSLPIPKAVWERLKPFQDDEFIAFVEAQLNQSAA
jgi:hypothetical protein